MKAGRMSLLALALITATAAQADRTANLGFASDYYYRGIFQASASANGGFDYEQSGFYAGTWAADVGDGLEIDGYFGFSGAVGQVGLSVGYTGYFYTGDFDDTYQEINLGSSFGVLAVDGAIGQYENFTGPTLDYTHYALSMEMNGFHASVGSFARDFSGEYLELGYSAAVAEFDLGVNIIFNDRDLSADTESDQALVFTISKSFDLR